MELEENLYAEEILQSMCAFVVIDKEWRYRFVNEKALRLFSRKEEELVGKTLWEIFPDIRGSVFDKQYRKVMRQSIPSSFETFHPPFNIWVDVRVYPYRDGISVFYTDITKRKKAEAEVSEIAERFRLFAKMTHAGIFHCDGDGNLLFLNDKCLELTGHRAEDMIGKPCMDVLFENRGNEPTRSWCRLLKDGEISNNKFSLTNKRTGEVHNFRLSVTAIPARNKQVKGYVGTLEDITEQVKAHAIIEESEKWFRSLADNSPMMIWSSDTERKCNYFNRVWLDFTGRTFEEEAGDGWQEGVFNEDLEHVLNASLKAFTERSNFSMKYRLRRYDGVYRWVSDNGRPLYLADGTFAGFIGSCTDIDEQVMAQQELEHRVNERTLDLLHILDREKELNNLKSHFVSTASHEFRTPLSTILSSAGLMETYIELNQPQNLGKHLDRIKNSVRYLTGVLEEFLSLERLEQGRVKAEKTVFDLRQFITETVDEVENMFKKEQNIRFYYEGDDVVCSDKKIIHHILLNLLSNAIKYSEKDVLLEVRSAGSQASITITDEGIGIPEEDHQNLFGNFFRASNVGSIRGTGLGLSIVKSYVEILKGAISFTSKKDVGTQFTVQFPLEANGPAMPV